NPVSGTITSICSQREAQTMSFKARLVVVCCVAAVGIATGQTDSAMLSVSGRVMLNGAPVSGSTSIFAGDKLETGAGSAAPIVRNGSSIKIGQSSSVLYEHSSVDVVEGSASIHTGTGVGVVAGNVKVTPSNNQAFFDVVRTRESLSIVSRRGTLN